MKALILLVTILLSSCCIYEDICYSLERDLDPNYSYNIGIIDTVYYSETDSTLIIYKNGNQYYSPNTIYSETDSTWIIYKY